MANINWLHLILQRPLVTILLFTLISGCILLILQSIASSSQDDEINHPARLIRQDEINFAFVPKRSNKNGDKYTLDPSTQGTEESEERINDLKRIRLSLREELKSLNQEKNKLLKDKSSLIIKKEKIVSQINKSKAQLRQLELDLSANKKQRFDQACSSDALVPLVFKPSESVEISNYNGNKEPDGAITFHPHRKLDRVYNFDYTLCPLTAKFKFNISCNRKQLLSKLDDNSNLDKAIIILQTLETHRQQSRGQDVCMTVIIIYKSNSTSIPTTRNNLVINLSGQPLDSLDLGNIASRAFVASPIFKKGTFRHNIDVVLPSIIPTEHSLSSILGSIPLHSPIKRKYFASYLGANEVVNGTNVQLSPQDLILQAIHRNSIDDLFLFIYDCGQEKNRPCYNEREKMIELSTFLIVIPNEHYDIDLNTNDLLYLSLSRGTIPVIVGSEFVRLPLDEAIDWRLAVILLPSSRLPEIHFILKSFGMSDLYSLKYQGRRIFENYLATSKQVIDATISLISLNRLNFPPLPINQTPTITYFPSKDLAVSSNCTACSDANFLTSILNAEILGPREKPFASPSFRRNFSLTLTRTYELWNQPLLSPNYIVSSHPKDPISPSEFKFMSLNQGFRPIGDGLGGSGLEFSQAVGGDYPNEQFTIVLLTYERIPMLMKTLQRLKGLVYLNKVLVVWNGINQKPHRDLVWPDIGVEIILVKVEKNSLNNRFLPYDAIETEAIFSMDDDSPLRPDEIVFAFRVWREARDRIVGFPGRFHAWDSYQNSWIYNSNHSCELSMVLTGGAFFHKYYAHVYSQIMPETIRSIVDKFMNCEDIAMNFLVAHLTRKPPIKVTSRWTFHCASCTSSLSEENSHFMERHECLNIFTSIYGYMPLLSTQHRSDSILFKTRLPKDKQKCFKFV